MNHVKVKICGLTRAEDVKSAVKAGADALGFVFTRSPRCIDAETAAQLVSLVPDNVIRIGLFMDQESSEIMRVVNAVRLDVLQFHGSETEEQCKIYNLPWLKAVAMENADSARQAEKDYPKCDGFIAGQPFRWRAWR